MLQFGYCSQITRSLWVSKLPSCWYLNVNVELNQCLNVSFLFTCTSVCIGYVFLCIQAVLRACQVLPWVACEAGYAAYLQPASEPALKLYTCAEKRSRHFSTACLGCLFGSVFPVAQCPFESSSVGDLFLSPRLFLSVDTMGPLYVRIPLLWDLAVYFWQFYIILLQTSLLLPLHWRKMQSNQGEIQWNDDRRTGLQELDCGVDKFHIEQVNMFLILLSSLHINT